MQLRLLRMLEQRLGNSSNNLRIFCSELLDLHCPPLIAIANCGNEILDPETNSGIRLAIKVAFSIRASKMKSLMMVRVLAAKSCMFGS